jgi:chromosome segregation ATPase
LLKRNHDVLMEKCELFRAQNQQAEKVALEKERLYNEMKMDADRSGSDLFRSQKYSEELKNLNEILEEKLKKFDEGNRAKDEQIKTLKIQKDKYQGQAKVHGEQLDVIQNSHDELATKKTNEIDMLSKEISQLTLKEKDVRQKLQWAESELLELKDHVRSVTTELDTRTQENDHLISLLEDQEQKMALYEQREKSIQNLASESKKRIEDANLERDRI